MRLTAESNNNLEGKPHQLGNLLSCLMFNFETFASLQSTRKKYSLHNRFQRLPNNQYLGRATWEISLVISQWLRFPKVCVTDTAANVVQAMKNGSCAYCAFPVAFTQVITHSCIYCNLTCGDPRGCCINTVWKLNPIIKTVQHILQITECFLVDYSAKLSRIKQNFILIHKLHFHIRQFTRVLWHLKWARSWKMKAVVVKFLQVFWQTLISPLACPLRRHKSLCKN